MWIYVPSACAPAMADSISGSQPLAHLSDGDTVLPLTWNGKPMRLRSLRAGWKRASWMQRLSGLTLSPSTLDAGAAQWIASLQASRASRTATPEAARVSTTNDGSGPTLHALFATLVHGLWCSKTYPDCFPAEVSPKYSATWPKWGSLRSGDAYRRQAWVPATNANGSSSSDIETPQWMTPMVPNGGRAISAALVESKGMTADGTKRTVGLESQTKYWHTPRANDAEKRGHIANDKRNGLAGQGKHWPTPNAADRKTSPDYPHKGGNPTLVQSAAAWPTPAARDQKGANSREHIMTPGGGSRHVDQLANFVVHCLHRGHAMTAGQASLQSDPTLRPRLNPAFGCWLMGLPEWWTNIDHTSCEPQEMASYHSRLQWELSRCFAGSDMQAVA